MSLNVRELTEVASETLELIGMIRDVRQAGGDEKTNAIETAALRVIDKLTAASQQAAGGGTAAAADVREVLEAQRKVLEARAQAPDLTLQEFTAVQSELSNISVKLFVLRLDQTLTWNQLLSPAELQMFSDALGEAAQQVRRRKKLQAVIRSLTSAFTMALNLTSKVVGLVV